MPVCLHTDPHSAFHSLTTGIENVVIDVRCHRLSRLCPSSLSKIRIIKEVYCAVKATLAWKTPSMTAQDLVVYAVSCINMQRATAISLSVAPRVLFTGLKADYQKEMELSFGDYCEDYNGMENNLESQSIPCIALYLCCNATGSWIFLNLISKKRARRSQWKRMVTTEEFISKKNAFVEKVNGTVQETPEMADHIGMQEDQQTNMEAEEKKGEEPSGAPPEDLGDKAQDEVLGLETKGDDDSDSEEDDDDEQTDPENEGMLCRSERIKKGVRCLDQYMMHTKLRKGSHNTIITIL